MAIETLRERDSATGVTQIDALHSPAAPQQSSFEERAGLIRRLVEANLVAEAQCNVSACGSKCRGAT